MLSAFGSALRTPDLRKKLAFTFAMIVLYRLGASIPTPNTDSKAIRACISSASGGSNQATYALINLFSGGALLKLSVFALGIMPYITASIIVQLLVVVIPRFEALKKEGQSGQNKLTQYSRYLTIGLAILQASGFVALARTGQLFSGVSNCEPLYHKSIFPLAVMVITMTAGTAVVMWFGELVTDRGVGNGMSILMFTSIAARIPNEGQTILNNSGGFAFTLIILLGLAIIAAVVFVEQAQRRIPVQYAKRMIGRRMYGGTSTYLPLKVNMAGVIPVIFASSLLYIPQLVSQLQSNSTSGLQRWVNTYLINQQNWVHI
ncbi:MAG: secY, partial [Pseudonocardiales bacterium]|nr:secY [Pseudonocardiales bacterium]